MQSKPLFTLSSAFVLFCGLLALPAGVARAQQRSDPLADVMVPPQLLMEHADQIGLDDEQKQFIRSQVEKRQEEFPALQQRLQREMAALGEVLHQEQPDEQKALAQLDKVLDAERSIKRDQLSMMLSIRGRLKPEQLAKVRELQQKQLADLRNRGQGNPQGGPQGNPQGGPPESLRAKFQQFQQRAMRARDQGQDMSALKAVMEQLQPLMREGKFKEAEEVLDHALQSLPDSGDKGQDNGTKPDGSKPDGPKPRPGKTDGAKPDGPRTDAAKSAGAGNIDMNKARALLEKSQHGETLTPEEQDYLRRAREARQQMSGKPAITGQESTGLVPLTQLKGDAKYKDQDGGLYGGGSNQPPESQAKLAREAAAKVVPLGPDGKPSPNGKVVLMSMGMSNTTQEFSRFKQLADADSAKSPHLLIVDAAQGGKDAAAWANVGNGTSNPTWEEADRRIKAAGATPQQVQVVWIKQALAGPARYGDFPAHAKELQKDVETALTVAKVRYPNLRLAYLSSRIYAGYANTMLNPEPYAYEGAFAVRWVIDDQVKGESKLNADPAKGEVKAPVVLWGPYLWADGTKGRTGDDLVWKPEDLGGDGTHPSPSGREKVAQLLLQFFKTDPTAKVWFTKRS